MGRARTRNDDVAEKETSRVELKDGQHGSEELWGERGDKLAERQVPGYVAAAAAEAGGSRLI